jgi:nucleoside-diphosphate-sugar epimerase
MIKRAIVSGAGGFIGKSLVRAMLAEGSEVVGLVRNTKSLDDITEHRERLTVVEATFEEYPDLPSRIEKRDFDVFFHMAWAGYGKATNDFRVQTQNIVDACFAATAAAALGCKKFLLADSSHEYLKSAAQINGEHQVGLCSIYGGAKAAAQRVCRVIAHNAGMGFAGVIFVNIFGPGDKSNRSTNTILRKLLKGESLDLIEGGRLYDWTYIDDCVGGVLAAAERGKQGKVYYVGSRVLRPFRDILTDVRDAVAPQAQLNFGKFTDNTYIDFLDINPYELYIDTGYLPQSDFKEGVKKTAAWLLELDAQP